MICWEEEEEEEKEEGDRERRMEGGRVGAGAGDGAEESLMGWRGGGERRGSQCRKKGTAFLEGRWMVGVEGKKGPRGRTLSSFLDSRSLFFRRPCQLFQQAFPSSSCKVKMNE